MEPPTGKTYVIRTLRDLCKVPPARRPICLAEILEVLATADRVTERTRQQLTSARFPRFLEWLRRYALRRIRTDIRVIVWIDDGKFTAEVHPQSAGITTTTLRSDDWRTKPVV